MTDEPEQPDEIDPAAMEDLTNALHGLRAHVEQLGAELKDPETSLERKHAILTELRRWKFSMEMVQRSHDRRYGEQEP